MQHQTVVIIRKRHIGPQNTIAAPIKPPGALGELMNREVISADHVDKCGKQPKFYMVSKTYSSATYINGSRHETAAVLSALANQGILQKRQLITTKELAQLLGLEPQTIAKWRSAGIADPPPAIHLGRQVRYDAEEVMSWIYRNRL